MFFAYAHGENSLTVQPANLIVRLIVSHANVWCDMLHYDFENSIGYWLVMTAQACERALSAELLPQGITYRQCQVLGWLVHEGDLSQNELAERMRVEPPTLTGILDRMERSGWVERHVDVHDRRRKLIRPGPQAEPIWAKIVACLRRVRTDAVRGLSSEEVTRLRELLGRVQTNLNELALVEKSA